MDSIFPFLDTHSHPLNGHKVLEAFRLEVSAMVQRVKNPIAAAQVAVEVQVVSPYLQCGL